MTETNYRIEVWRKRHIIRHNGAERVKLYFLQGALSEEQLTAICQSILVDPVTEAYHVNKAYLSPDARHSIDVSYLPGVTDAAAESLQHAAAVLGIHGILRAATGYRVLLHEILSDDSLQHLASSVYANPLIQRYSLSPPISAPFVPVDAVDDTVETISLRSADDNQLLNISQERRLSLDLNEMRAIRDHFQELQREPTDAELETLAQTWSEHCVHKTFKALIDYTGPLGADPYGPVETITVDGILNSYIRAATEQVARPWVRSAFVDNAGIVQFDSQYDLAFKVETHNRPSALEPFGGANTGVGGVVRDVLGVSARPIANTDILCFAPPDLPPDQVPDGVLPPERVASGVIAGIEDYGNKMGIPTVNGAIHYDQRYTSNPLVFCGCLGILPHGSHPTAAQPGDLIVVIGGRTGRDGLRGATFSSMEMDSTTSVLSGGAVQIGHPIHEKQVQEVVLRARDEALYNAITDCGAGGLSSAVGEMGERIGATVYLERVPLKYPGLRPWEIWLSEAQERMVLAVPQSNWSRLQAICAGQDLEAVAIGTFTPTGQLTLYHKDQVVANVAMTFVHDGIPRRRMVATWLPGPNIDTPDMPENEDYNQTLIRLLGMPTIRSKEQVVRRYDHEVQGGTALKPMTGTHNAGPSDAAVLVPRETQAQASQRGVALSVGLCPQYGDIDPYAMAWAAVDEAVRNVVAVGTDPATIAILDNFSWGNTNLPDRLGSLVRAAQGCYDAAVAYGLPYISGKDSLNNEYLGADGQRHAIPGTLVISAIGIVPDISQTVTSDLKQSGNLLYLIGTTGDERGGSHYHLLHNVEGGSVPQPKPDAISLHGQVHQAVRQGIVRACHDISEGGLAVTLAEMCIAGGLGAAIDADPTTLFSESLSRYVVEVTPTGASLLEALSVPVQRLGEVTEDTQLLINSGGRTLIDLDLGLLTRAWRGEPLVTALYDAAAAEEAVPRSGRQPLTKKGNPHVLILHANGTNRDHDAALACEVAGGTPEIVHVNQLFSGERDLLDYHMLIVPGGFSYGDDLGAGVLWALDLRERLGTPLTRFIADGRPVLGICNGFQTLVKAGLLPGEESLTPRAVTLTENALGRFECRWVTLMPDAGSTSLFLDGLDSPLYVPVAHGEGRVMVHDASALEQLRATGAIGLRYMDAVRGEAAYPANPNGSVHDIAGLSNRAGNVFGLMPHPENHIFPWQHPRYHRGERGNDGLRIFRNGIRFA